jgi:hypothetical protein
MMMNAAIARALRRFVGGSAIMLAGLTGIRHWIFAEIQVPPADVDRVVVTSPDQRSHEITDPAAVARIVRHVRSLLDRALPIPDRTGFNPELRIWYVALHRETEAPDEIGLMNQVIFTQGTMFGVSTKDALDLHRLLRAEAAPVPSTEGEGG